MKAIIRRELKNYFKNPIFWIGLLIVISGVFQMVSPYLNLHYFKSDEEIQNLTVSTISEADIIYGYIPSSFEQQKSFALQEIIAKMQEEATLSNEDIRKIYNEVQNMDIQDMPMYFETNYGFYGVEYILEDFEYYQGNVDEVNEYIQEKMSENSFSYYFSRKFADSVGLYSAFFSLVFFAFLFFQDTKKNNYELLHTKPIRAWQYVLGKISGGFSVILFSLGVLNLIFIILSIYCAKGTGFEVNPLDFISSTVVYIIPNVLMIICVYTIIALAFKNPLPAIPILFLYIIYSNMGSTGIDGKYGYYGKPLSIMVRFPGRFFDTTPPPMALLNQTFLIMASGIIICIAIFIWKRRRVY